MALKKLPNNTEIEELLSLLESTPVIDENSEKYFGEDIEINDDVLNFTAAFKIEAGEFPIRKSLIYKIYFHWSRNPVKRNIFSLKLSQYIPVKNNSYYLIKHNIFKLTKITKVLLEQRRKRQRRRIRLDYFKKFFEHYSIKPGKFFIEGYILHYLYQEWCDKFRRRSKYNLANFQAALKLFFETRQPKRYWFFRVDETVLKYLPQTKLEALRKGRRYYGKKEEPSKQD